MRIGLLSTHIGMRNHARVRASMILANNGRSGLGYIPPLNKDKITPAPQMRFDPQALKKRFVPEMKKYDHASFAGHNSKKRNVWLPIPSNTKYVLKEGRFGKLEASYVGPRHEDKKPSGI